MMTDQDIRDAIAADRLCFYYQPKVSLITGKIVGAEALIRCVAESGAIVPPAEFIPQAERSALIKQITSHMFGKLLRDMVLLAECDPIVVSFNTSARDFEDAEFSGQMLQALKYSKIDRKLLEIEITETAMLQASSAVRTHIEPLRHAGIRLAMDDFGIGYSSIDTLSNWPFTTLKLDQGIVSRILDNEKNATIVESSIRMAHELGMEVIAEGVESRAHYRHLMAMGCSQVQGYWISYPLPLDEFILLLKQDRRWSGLPVGLIHMAIMDHVQWRKQLVSEVLRASSRRPNSPARQRLNTPAMSCRECRLGRWYYNEGQAFADKATFRAIEVPHTAFHKSGLQLLDMVAQGAEMDAVIPVLREMSEYSLSILGKLQALENEGLMDLLHDPIASSAQSEFARLE